MVRAAWVRGRRLDGPPGRRVTLAADLLIEGATVVDGTGGPGRPGRIAIVGDRLALPGDEVDVSASRTIDAAGLVVAPGFIDLHSHGGLVMLAEPRHEPKVRQGVTTELIGVDGNAYAPFPRHEDLEDFAVLNGGLDGRPDIAFDWSTVAAVPRPVRRHDLGQRRLRRRQLAAPDRGASAGTRSRPTHAPWPTSASMLGEAMEEGAFGLSTGLDYPPGAYATTEELAELMAEAARLGGFYHTHVRYPLGDGFLDPFREAIEIGGGAARPCTSRTSTTGRRSRDRPSSCSASSTTHGPRASTSPSTCTPTSGRARAC